MVVTNCQEKHYAISGDSKLKVDLYRKLSRIKVCIVIFSEEVRSQKNYLNVYLYIYKTVEKKNENILQCNLQQWVRNVIFFTFLKLTKKKTILRSVFWTNFVFVRLKL